MEKNNITFEEAYNKLEEIAERLNSPKITLEESIVLFEEGIKLSKHCSEILDAAKQKIEQLENGEE